MGEAEKLTRDAPFFLTAAINFSAFIAVAQRTYIKFFFRHRRCIRMVLLLMLQVIVIVRNTENDFDGSSGLPYKAHNRSQGVTLRMWTVQTALHAAEAVVLNQDSIPDS